MEGNVGLSWFYLPFIDYKANCCVQIDVGTCEQKVLVTEKGCSEKLILKDCMKVILWAHIIISSCKLVTNLAWESMSVPRSQSLSWYYATKPMTFSLSYSLLGHLFALCRTL